MKATWKNITIIGTSHISKSSIKEIADFFLIEHPDVVAVELDRARYHALMHEEKPSIHLGLVRRIGVSGFLFALIGRAIQKKLGNIVGTAPGADMKCAIDLALEHHTGLQLIDQHIEETLADFSKRFTLREKLRMLKDIIIPPEEAKSLKLVRQDLRRVPDQQLITRILSFISSRYPGLFEALIGKRNRHMARKLFMMHHEPAGKKILAVVGAGHLQGVIEELKRLERTIDVVSK